MCINGKIYHLCQYVRYVPIPFNRNEAALKQVAESCKEKGSPDVQFFVKDLIDAEACRATVEDAVAHFGGTEIFSMFRLSKQVHYIHIRFHFEDLMFLSILPESL